MRKAFMYFVGSLMEVRALLAMLLVGTLLFTGINMRAEIESTVDQVFGPDDTVVTEQVEVKDVSAVGDIYYDTSDDPLSASKVSHRNLVLRL